jgi:hypothetical protein
VVTPTNSRDSRVGVRRSLFSGDGVGWFGSTRSPSTRPVALQADCTDPTARRRALPRWRIRPPTPRQHSPGVCWHSLPRRPSATPSSLANPAATFPRRTRHATVAETRNRGDGQSRPGTGCRLPGFSSKESARAPGVTTRLSAVRGARDGRRHRGTRRPRTRGLLARRRHRSSRLRRAPFDGEGFVPGIRYPREHGRARRLAGGLRPRWICTAPRRRCRGGSLPGAGTPWLRGGPARSRAARKPIAAESTAVPMIDQRSRFGRVHAPRNASGTATSPPTNIAFATVSYRKCPSRRRASDRRSSFSAELR